MRYRALGRTGLNISEVSLGTVQMGLPYGIPDKDGYIPVLEEQEALNILYRAFQEGVNFLDTARNYGTSEAVIGKALHGRQDDIYVATKLRTLSEDMTDAEIRNAIKISIEESRRILNRRTIELLQVHNATQALLQREVVSETLHEMQQKEWIRFLGVSTYGITAPQFALDQEHWDTLQVEFNLLNQQTAMLFEDIRKKNRGLIIRSAMLKGALTTEENHMPEHLKPIAQKARELKSMAPDFRLSPPHLALSYVLSHSAVSTVITGVMNVEQLVENCAASELPHWSTQQLAGASAFNLGESALTDPRQWGF